MFATAAKSRMVAMKATPIRMPRKVRQAIQRAVELSFHMHRSRLILVVDKEDLFERGLSAGQGGDLTACQSRDQWADTAVDLEPHRALSSFRDFHSREHRKYRHWLSKGHFNDVGGEVA